MSGVEFIFVINKVICNIYMLFLVMFLFVVVIVSVVVVLKLLYFGLIVMLVGYFGLLFVIIKLCNSGWGLVLVFVLIGFMGYMFGFIVSYYFGLFNGG